MMNENSICSTLLEALLEDFSFFYVWLSLAKRRIRQNQKVSTNTLLSGSNCALSYS